MVVTLIQLVCPVHAAISVLLLPSACKLRLLPSLDLSPHCSAWPSGNGIVLSHSAFPKKILMSKIHTRKMFVLSNSIIEKQK